MTSGLPVPRDGGAGITGGTNDVLQYVAGTVGRLEESVERGFREVREDMADMRRETLPRHEFDQQHGELRERVARIEAAREAERQAQLEAERQAARDQRTARRARIALWTSSALALGGTASGVVLHFT